MRQNRVKRRGGHAYGRRNQTMSNTAEQGELCIYTGHSLGQFSSHSMRYDSHQACVRCVASAREGRISFDVDRMLKRERRRALKFWSQVEIGSTRRVLELGWMYQQTYSATSVCMETPWYLFINTTSSTTCGYVVHVG